MRLPSPIRMADEIAALARQARRALLTRPDAVPALLAMSRSARQRQRPEARDADRWLARARCVAPADPTVLIATLGDLWRRDPVRYDNVLRNAPDALIPSSQRFLLRAFGRQENSATLARMIVEAAAESGITATEAYRTEFACLGIRSRPIDYIATKAVILTGRHRLAETRIDSLAGAIAAALPRVARPDHHEDLPADRLRDLADDYKRLIEIALTTGGVPWHQDAMAPERRRPEISADWLRAVFTMAYGPDLGIMHGEWRSRAISDAAAGDRFNDFAYERHEDGVVPEIGPAKAQIIRLYGLNVIADLLEREADDEAAATFFGLLWRRDGIPDPRFPVCRLADAPPVETTTRDVISAERSMWLRRRLRNADVRIDTSLEIGAGYGHLSANLLRLGLTRRAVIIDRPLNLVVAKRFLEVFFPGRVALLPFDDPADATVLLVPPWLGGEVPERIDLLLNFISFQHMTQEVIDYYDRIIGPRRPSAVLMENFTLDWICDALPRSLEGLSLAGRSVRLARPRPIERALWLRP